MKKNGETYFFPIFCLILRFSKIQKYAKVKASVQHGLSLFTCEISSVNSTALGLNIQKCQK